MPLGRAGVGRIAGAATEGCVSFLGPGGQLCSGFFPLLATLYFFPSFFRRFA